ncbi:MAG: TetR/AcrR family transcriptional regulator [Ilumatobacter sp.]|nr:TetR/AcrR family transcriptional regulator [Ilumatobacter sp.]
MGTTLRDRQKRVARELILQAAADEIAERGLEDLSLRTIADRAGVSKRTLYNYFDSREALFTAICDWSDQLTLELGGYLAPAGLDTLPERIQAVWRTWGAQGTVFEAVVRISAASGVHTAADRRARRRALAAAVGAARPDLTGEQHDAVGVLLHAITSAPVFQRLTIEDGVESGAAADLVSWTVEVIRDAIENGSDPFPKEDEP